MPANFHYQEPFPLGADQTKYRLLTRDYVSVSEFEGKPILKVAPEGLTLLANQAFHDINFYLRTEHLQQVASILADPEASDNDRTVALAMLRNAEVAAKGVLPFCQDTGTAAITAKKGQQVWTSADDAEALSLGVYQAYAQNYLRYSQLAPVDLYTEKNTGTNLPAQIDIAATSGAKFEFLFVAKGGGSANKCLLFQETKAVLNPKSLPAFLVEKMKGLGTAACPPYHLAIVIGGTSAEATMKAVKLASTHYYDELPTKGNEYGQAFRDKELESILLKEAHQLGIGAQFGGKWFALDVRVIRLPRHGASCPIGMAVSCSADRNAKARIDKDGIWIEQLEMNPGRFIPEANRKHQDSSKVVKVDLNRPMKEVLTELSKYPVTTRLALTGTLVVARDLAHAKLRERLERGEGLPDYIKNFPVYYAGPAKTPAGMASGSFGPTTAGRMDSYVELFQKHGGSLIMIAKGNRGQAVTDSCKKHGGFYLGSIGGPAAILAQENIRKVDVIDYAELGMEAVWKIEVVDFPAFILIDDKGVDFFQNLPPGCGICSA